MAVILRCTCLGNPLHCGLSGAPVTGATRGGVWKGSNDCRPPQTCPHPLPTQPLYTSAEHSRPRGNRRALSIRSGICLHPYPNLPTACITAKNRPRLCRSAPVQPLQISVPSRDALGRRAWRAPPRHTCRFVHQDKEFAYGPFLPLLGTGLVTSEGELWKKQRLMVSSVFRIEVWVRGPASGRRLGRTWADVFLPNAGTSCRAFPSTVHFVREANQQHQSQITPGG